MHIALGCDHRGLKLKQAIMGLLTELGHDYQDFGCYSTDPVDYPDIAKEVAGAVVFRKVRARDSDLQQWHRHEHSG